MRIDEHKHGAVTVMRAQGPVAGADAQDFAQRVQRATRETLGRLVLDASAIPFVDSSALEAMLDASDILGDMGSTLKICGANETLREVLDLTGIASSVEQFESVSDAVRSFL